MRALPKYKCHKEVWALKIEAIKHHNEDDPNAETDGTAVITPVENLFAPFEVSAEYMRKHKPTLGGYWVQYEGGYQSFSPAEPFEAGYELMA